MRINNRIIKNISSAWDTVSRCSINVSYLCSADSNNDDGGDGWGRGQGSRSYRDGLLPSPLSGEKGRSQLITDGGWGGGVRLESLLGLFTASLFH